MDPADGRQLTFAQKDALADLPNHDEDGWMDGWIATAVSSVFVALALLGKSSVGQRYEVRSSRVERGWR